MKALLYPIGFIIIIGFFAFLIWWEGRGKR